MATVSYLLNAQVPNYSFDLTSLDEGLLFLDQVTDPDLNALPRIAVPATTTEAGDYMSGSSELAAAALAIESLGDGGILVGDTSVDGLVTALTISGAVVGSVLTVSNLSPGTLAWSTPGIPWVAVAGTSQALVANTGYFANNVGLTTFTLPASAAIGATFEIVGPALWRIAQNAGQKIILGNTTTTIGVGGSIASTNTGDTIRLVCSNATPGGEIFRVLTAVGELTIV